MSTPQLLTVAYFALVTRFVLLSNKDAISPAKIILGFLLLIYGGSMLSESTLTVYFLLSALLSFTVVGAIVESPVPINRTFKFPAWRNRRVVFWLWVSTMAPLVAFMYLASSFGGIYGYIDNIEYRVINFAGLGLLIVTIKSVTSISSVYFAYLLWAKCRSKSSWALFFMHLLLASSIALLTGSRNTVLVTLVIMLMAVPLYTRVRFSVLHVAGAFCLLLTLLLGLGQLRNQRAEVSGGESISFSFASMSDSRTLSYGVTPIEKVYERPPLNNTKGMTFVAALTNFVPRNWWPEKPEGGGAVYTRYYFGNVWGGASVESPGIFAESVINFGVVGGTIFALSLMGLFIVAVCLLYRHVVKIEILKPEIFLIYAFSVIFVCNLPFAEFSTAVNNFVTRGLLAVGLAVVVRKRLVIRAP